MGLAAAGCCWLHCTGLGAASWLASDGSLLCKALQLDDIHDCGMHAVQQPIHDIRQAGNTSK
jgi:hypothetical protein